MALSSGLAVRVVADAVIAVAFNRAGLFIGVALWDAYPGLTQGLLPLLVADTAPEDLRATTFGMFNLITGVTLSAASLLAGLL